MGAMPAAVLGGLKRCPLTLGRFSREPSEWQHHAGPGKIRTRQQAACRVRQCRVRLSISLRFCFLIHKEEVALPQRQNKQEQD